jgi:long-chain fatty acid transport protein
MWRWLTIPILCLAARAAASPAEVFGLGSRAAGVGGAAAAWIDDFSAAHYNPAGLAFAPARTLTVGLLGSKSMLEVNDAAYRLPEPLGVIAGAVGPAPLGGALAGRVHVGLGLYVLPSAILRITARLPDEPFYPYYDRTQRLTLLPAIAVRLAPGLALGVAVNALASVDGQVLAAPGPTRALEARVDEEIPPSLAVNAGVRWQASPRHALALVYRQAFSVGFRTLADAEIAGEALTLDLSAEELYTPHQLALGYAFRTATTAVGLDVTASRWSAYGGPYVRVASELPLVGALAGTTPEVRFEDTLGLRAGVEHRAGRVFLRGGWGWESSAIPAEQPGVTNLLDGPKHTFSLGLGVALGAVRLDLHAAAQLVGSRTLHKRIADPDEEPAAFEALRDEVIDDPGDPETLGAQISNPGWPFIDSGGLMLSGGMSLEVSL